MSNLSFQDLKTINTLLNEAECILDNVRVLRLDFQENVFKCLQSSNDEHSLEKKLA